MQVIMCGTCASHWLICPFVLSIVHVLLTILAVTLSFSLIRCFMTTCFLCIFSSFQLKLLRKVVRSCYSYHGVEDLLCRLDETPLTYTVEVQWFHVFCILTGCIFSYFYSQDVLRAYTDPLIEFLIFDSDLHLFCLEPELRLFHHCLDWFWSLISEPTAK